MTTVCHKCKKLPASVNSRNNFKYCDACFVTFVQTKQKKVLNNILNLNSDDNILLPISLGVSSLAVLDILIDQIISKFIDPSIKINIDLVHCYYNKLLIDSLKSDLSNIKTYFTSLLRDKKKNNVFINCYLIDLNEISTLNKQSLELISLDSKTFKAFKNTTIDSNAQSFHSDPELLTLSIYNTILDASISLNSNLIVWGNSMINLSYKILSLIIKGRSNEINPFLNNNIFPLKDISLDEIKQYCSIIFNKSNDTLSNICNNDISNNQNNDNTLLIKNMSIEQISEKYFINSTSNIVSTVLRTAEKLDSVKSTSSKNCHICKNVIVKDPVKWLNDITVNSSHPIETEEEQRLFNNWQQANSTTNAINTENIDEIPICYGCMILINSKKNKSVIWNNNLSVSDNNILNEYIL